MNYQRIYTQLIQHAQMRDKPVEYTEKHHIIPRCMGGSNNADNMAVLTAREHFIAHHLLYKIYQNTPFGYKMAHAFGMMSTLKLLRKLTARQYETIRRVPRPISEETKGKISAANKGRKLPPVTAEAIQKRKESNRKTQQSKTMSEEERLRRSAAQKGKKTSDITKAKLSIINSGKAMLPQTKAALLKANTGRFCSPETKDKISKAQIGKIIPEEVIDKVRKALKGRKQTPEHVANMRRATKGVLRTNITKERMSNSAKSRSLCTCVLCRQVYIVNNFSSHYKRCSNTTPVQQP